MQQQKLGSRNDVAELKGVMVKKLGAERSKWYFYNLQRLWSRKLSKSEFDKLCQRVLGRENLRLHSQLIHAILKNVCTAKTPPPVSHEEGPVRSGTEASLNIGGPSTSAATWSNGVALSRKVKLDNHVWKFRNRRSRPEDERDVSMQQHMRKQCLSRSVDGLVSMYRKGKVGELPGHFSSQLLAPLGIPFCSASVGGSRKALPLASGDKHLSCCCSGELSDTETLRSRMEQIAAVQNLGGVSLECANLLNKTLDVHLKRLIRSCIDLVESKTGNETKSNHLNQKQQTQGKYLNGLLPNNQLQMATSGGVGSVHEERHNPAISLLDFKVAMELNPQQLGEEWPTHFERICMYSFKG